jgi:hypothetical protein
MPMDKKIGQFNSNHQASYSECSYATPYVVEKEVTPTCSTPYASCNFHNSAPYVSNDYSRINEHSSSVYTPPHAIIVYPSPPTLAPYVAENHSRINGIPLSIPCGKQLKAKKCSTNEIHQDVEGHNPEYKVDGVGISTLGDFQHNWKNRSDRSIKPVRLVLTGQTTAKHLREVKLDVIHVKVPRVSNIFDKVCFTSILSNF